MDISLVIQFMIIIPINNTLIYVEPVYQVSLNEKVQVQSLRKVIVASGNKIAIGDNLKTAIDLSMRHPRVFSWFLF